MSNDNHLEKDIEELKKQAEEYLNGWKRSKADLVNYQKQIERERADWFLFANAGCLKEFLPVLDSLDQAVARHGGHHEGTDKQDGLAHGIAKIRNQMLDILRQMGVEQIKTVGEPINAEFHEAVGVEKSDRPASHPAAHTSATLGSVAPAYSAGRHAPGIIVKQIQAGYIMHGKVLRAAKVIVAE